MQMHMGMSGILNCLDKIRKRDNLKTRYWIEIRLDLVALPADAELDCET